MSGWPRIDLQEALSTTRAIRRLRSDPIPPEVLRRVVQAATWGPSGGNRQPWRFVLVRDPESKARLQAWYAALWNGYWDGARPRLAALPEVEREAAERMLAAGDHLAAHLSRAPVLVLVCARLADLAITDAGLDRPSLVGGASVYPAVQNLLLAARAHGLGGVITTVLCQREADVKALLGIPAEYATCAMVPLGFPERRGHGPLRRLEPSEVAFADRWDRPVPEWSGVREERS